MRIIGFFVRAVLFIAIAGGLVYAFGGQIWMTVSLRTFDKDIDIVADAASSLEAQRKRCQTAPSASVYSTPRALQLRFTSDREYVVELICTLIEGTPLQLAQGQLPLFVTKQAGSAGLYYDYEQPTKHTFVLQSLRGRKSYSFDGKLVTALSEQKLSRAISPVTSCAGWGYRCCQQDGEKGSGVAQAQGVSDCSGRCFSSCQPTPYFQGFIADPYPSQNSEVLMTSESMQVTFSYTAGIASGRISSVQIDFGDGQSDTSTEISGVFTHTYSCPGPCRYKAVVKALDANGNSSVENDLSTLYIVRR